jgi:hypothetical protein
MATKPAFANIPRQGQASFAVADTSLTAPASVGIVFTAGASGSRVERLRVTAAATTVAALVNIFLHDGTNYRLIRSLVVAAVTVSATVPAWGMDGAGLVTFEGGLMLPTGWSLRVTTTIAQTMHATADGADF